MKANPLPTLSITDKQRFDMSSLKGAWSTSKEFLPNNGLLIKDAIQAVIISKGKDILCVEDVVQRLTGKILLGPSVMKALLDEHAKMRVGEESTLEKIYQKTSATKLCFSGCDLTDEAGCIFWMYLFRVGFERWTQNVRWHKMGFDGTFTFVTYK
jgi:hypothetical protein